MKFNQVTLISILLFSPQLYADSFIDMANDLMSKDPKEAHENAISNKDYTLFSVILCAETMPGFNFRDYRGEKPIVKHVGLSCNELLGESKETSEELKSWIREYNELMYEYLMENNNSN